MVYADLGACVGREQPLYGLEAHGVAVDAEPDTTIESMAARYVAAIGTVQPRGPYALGGWSAGGLVAYEMAQQLAAKGEEVAVLAILDSTAPGEYEEDDDEARLLADFLTLFTAEPFAELLVRLTPLGSDQRLLFALERAREARALPPGFGLADARRLLRVYRAHAAARRRYRARAYPGSIVVLRPSDPPIRSAGASDAVWRRLARGGYRVESVPGNHMSMVTRPHVEVLGRALTAVLSEHVERAA
jgi:thioesterase domain-containing protein